MVGTLSGVVISPNVTRVLVVAHELGIKLDFKFIDLGTGQHKKEEFLALNPFGQIPAYVSDDGLTLFESRAIAKYLDATSGGKLTHNKDPKAYGLVETWGYVEENQWSKYAQLLYFELFIKPTFLKAASDQDSVDSNKASLVKSLEVYEKHFTAAKSFYITGSDLSIADLFHLPVIAPLVSGANPLIPDLLAPFPHVKAWVDRLLALPSWKAVVQEQADFFAQITGTAK